MRVEIEWGSWSQYGIYCSSDMKVALTKLLLPSKILTLSATIPHITLKGHQVFHVRGVNRSLRVSSRGLWVSIGGQRASSGGQGASIEGLGASILDLRASVWGPEA